MNSEKLDAIRNTIVKMDAYVNQLNGLGGTNTPLNNTFFTGGTLLNQNTLEELYRYNWLARRIVEIPSQDATREWITFEHENKILVENVHDYIEEKFIQDKVTIALNWARLYGGSVIIIGALDGQSPEQPLLEENISDIKYFTVLDRFQLQVREIYNNPLSENFGNPKLYELTLQQHGTNETQGLIIHESRLIRFDGLLIPERQKEMNLKWHDSVLVAINEDLKGFGMTMQTVHEIVQEFISKHLKMNDFADMLASGRENDIRTRLQFAMSCLSNLGFVVTGEGEDFTKQQTPINGLSDLLNVIIEVTSTAANIPRTRLFGQQLGVLAGATENTRAYYDGIKSEQNKKLKKPLEKIIRLILKNKSFVTHGVEPDNWGFVFNPLWQKTDEEKMTLKTQQASIDQIYVSLGVLTAEEVANSRFQDEYSFETKLNEEARNESTGLNFESSHNHLQSDNQMTVNELPVGTSHAHEQTNGEMTGVAIGEGEAHYHQQSDGNNTGPSIPSQQTV